MTCLFLAAIDRIPLGTAVAIEFLGPLSVAALRSHNRRALAWPAMALGGVLLLTEPWHGAVNLAGVGLAAGSAVGWAAYILLTQHIGDRFSGLQGTQPGRPSPPPPPRWSASPGRRPHHRRGSRRERRSGGTGAGPAVRPGDDRAATHGPRRLRNADGAEPAIGVVLGLVVLHQKPSLPQVLGIMLVTFAGAAAQRNARRQPAGAYLTPGDLSRPAP